MFPAERVFLGKRRISLAPSCRGDFGETGKKENGRPAASKGRLQKSTNFTLTYTEFQHFNRGRFCSHVLKEKKKQRGGIKEKKRQSEQNRTYTKRGGGQEAEGGGEEDAKNRD